MRRSVLLWLAMVVLTGCAGRVAEEKPGAEVPDPAWSAPNQPTERSRPDPASPPGGKPEGDARPSVRMDGTDLEIVGLKSVRSITWSPSGRRAVVQAGEGAHLLDVAELSLTALPNMNTADRPVFWSETQLLVTEPGRFFLRDLATNQDHLLHTFGGNVLHYLRPWDTHVIFNRVKGANSQGYMYGSIVSARLGDRSETLVIDEGHLVGRMVTGQILAVKGTRQGPLSAITSDGKLTLLSKDPVYFPAIAPDGARALWFTGPPPGSSFLDIFRPAVAHADGPYDPPLTDLWTWDGRGDPVRIPLDGVYSAQAEFAPEGGRIALALNQEFVGPEIGTKPGRVAVVEGSQIRSLLTVPGRITVGMWLGSDGFEIMRWSTEKTGAQRPIERLDLSGRTTTFSTLWHAMGRETGEKLLLNWLGGNGFSVYWRGSARAAYMQGRSGPNIEGVLHLSKPSDPFIGINTQDGVRLHRLRPLQSASDRMGGARV